jgi:hypothetical protein
MRISIRPVTLRRIVEAVDLSIKRGGMDSRTLSTLLKTTERRGQEILSELKRMKLVDASESGFAPNNNAIDFLNAFQQENWEGIHLVLFNNYPFYRVFISTIREKLPQTSFSKDDLMKALICDSALNFNRTAIDVLCDWSERLGIVQRNLYTGQYYLASENPNADDFTASLQTVYEELNIKPRPGMKQEYVEVARMREFLCEKLKTKREIFDLLFGQVFKRSCGKIELSGAPITSMAKSSPTTLKKMKRGMKDSILSPQFICLSEARGIEINGKEYQYIAIFEPLR